VTAADEPRGRAAVTIRRVGEDAPDSRPETTTGGNMRRTIVAGGVALVGVLFIVMTFAQNLFRVGTDFEEMITDFRPILVEENIATYQADIAGFAAVADEFQNGLAPWAAGNLGMTPDEFGAFTAQEYPAVAAGMEALPAVTTQFGGLVDLLDQERGHFARADAIPTTSFVAQTVPWGFLALGIIALVAAAVAWFGRFRLGALLALVVGVAIVVFSFLLSLPGKAADADDLNDALKPVYTEETITGAGQALETMGAMGAEMGSSMLPDLAEQLGVTPDELNATLGESFPATAQALGSLDDSLARFSSLGETFSANLENYETLRPVAFTPIIWMFLFGGFVMAVLGAYGIFRREDEAAAG
jgi:hypothetical protein